MTIKRVITRPAPPESIRHAIVQPPPANGLFRVPTFSTKDLASPIILIVGPGMVGKTTLASTLSELGKVAYLGIDYRHPQTDLNAFAKRKDNIEAATFSVVELTKGQSVDPREWQPEWQRFWDATMESFTNPRYIGTIIDKWVVADRLCRLALWGKWEQVPEMGYEHRNTRLKSILDAAINNKKILVLITNDKEKRENVVNENTGKKVSVSTGDFEPAGWKNTREATTLELWCSHSRKDGFQVECGKAVSNWDLVGTKVTGQSLPDIMRAAFPGVVLKNGWGR